MDIIKNPIFKFVDCRTRDLLPLFVPQIIQRLSSILRFLSNLDIFENNHTILIECVLGELVVVNYFIDFVY